MSDHRRSSPHRREQWPDGR